MMKDNWKIIIVIIAIMNFLGYYYLSDDYNAPQIARQISDGAQTVASSLDGIESAVKEKEKETEMEHYRELGYPEGYDPTNPIANGEFTEEDWKAMQDEAAMRSLAEEALRDEAMEEEIFNRDPLF